MKAILGLLLLIFGISYAVCCFVSVVMFCIDIFRFHPAERKVKQYEEKLEEKEGELYVSKNG